MIFTPQDTSDTSPFPENVNVNESGVHQQAKDIWAESGDIRYLYLLHQPVLFFIICLGELVDLDFVLLDFPHDLVENKRIFKQLQAEPVETGKERC